jgi:hypothetical protein
VPCSNQLSYLSSFRRTPVGGSPPNPDRSRNRPGQTPGFKGGAIVATPAAGCQAGHTFRFPTPSAGPLPFAHATDCGGQAWGWFVPSPPFGAKPAAGGPPSYENALWLRMKPQQCFEIRVAHLCRTRHTLCSTSRTSPPMQVPQGRTAQHCGRVISGIRFAYALLETTRLQLQPSFSGSNSSQRFRISAY